MLRSILLCAAVCVGCAGDDATDSTSSPATVRGPASFAGPAPVPVPPADPATHRLAEVAFDPIDAVDGSRAPREFAP